jgi:hypothetical protein
MGSAKKKKKETLAWPDRIARWKHLPPTRPPNYGGITPDVREEARRSNDNAPTLLRTVSKIPCFEIKKR